MVAIQAAAPDDAAGLAALFRDVWRQDLPFLPVLHTPAEDRAFFAGLIATQRVIVARESNLVGFCACRDGWIDQLYVARLHQGVGIGRQLVAAALDGQREARLWTFQRNERAIRFYQARGFREERRTDGERNEENEPDMLMVWRADR